MKNNYYRNERCIIFDESGNLGNSGRYFIIACIDTDNFKALHSVMKRKLGIAKKLFPELATLHSNEIKAKDAYPCIKHHILETISEKELKISYIVADLQYVKPTLLVDKNILYNYLMKLLLDTLIKNEDDGTTINIICDNKTTKVKSLNSFTEYIKLHFIYERGYELKLNVVYMDSDDKNAFSVQAADYVANALYGNFEYNDSTFYDCFKGSIRACCKFPYCNFGK
jgi:hypothetical protein